MVHHRTDASKCLTQLHIVSLFALGLPFCLVSFFAAYSNFYMTYLNICSDNVEFIFTWYYVLCCISLIFVACLEFVNICKDLFVCHLWIGKLSVHNILACLLNLIFGRIYLFSFQYLLLIL